MTKKQKKSMIRILVSAALLIVLQLIPAESYDAVFGAFGRWVRLGGSGSTFSRTPSRSRLA